MPQGPDITRWPRVGPRVLGAELLLDGAEVALCGIPLVLWLRGLPAAAPIERALWPILLAAVIALFLHVHGRTRPVAALLEAKRRQEPVSAGDVEAAQRALARVPKESGLSRLLLWIGVAAAVLVLALARGAGHPRLAAGFASVVIFHGAGLAALRALVLARTLACLQPLILPNVEGIRVFAGSYRFWLAAIVVAGIGLGHAALALMVWTFTGVSARSLALMSLLLWPTVAGAVLVWSRSLLRRTGPIEDYFEATLRSPGTRGPARDEPRAVVAFIAAQSLPYRLSAYQAFSFALAGVIAVAAGRRLGAIDVASAGRLLGAVAVVSLAGLVYVALAIRRSLGPLMRHIGSRHFLPVAKIRSRVGLRPKLLGCFLIVAAVACGALALYAHAPAATIVTAPHPALALVVGLALALGLTGLVVREVVEPIQALEARSEEMARGELARPVPPSGEADEIGRLTVAFEEMRRSLRDRLRSTESINIDLEREVRRRTEALEQRNADLRDALEKLRRAQDNLIRSEKLASMGRLVSGIAHEINNPVNAVINSLGPLEETVRQLGATKDPEAAELARSAEEMLSVVQRGAARTKAIVQALHNYSRGDEAVQREVNLARSVEDSLDLLRHRLRNVQVKREVEPTARILGLPGQIDQVLMNLITNAAQALGEKGGTIRVAVAVRGAQVEVSVTDDGPGIPPDVLPRIFDPFFTTKDVGEGSGLGLSIVHGIVERHGGTIDVQSEPGRGTTFRITFPRFGTNAAATGG
jgi:signal transduction histidine kinase